MNITLGSLRVGLIEGDGIGLDISPVAARVLDAAVARAYGGDRKIAWVRLEAGERCFERYGQALPAATVDAIRELRVALKGPLTTPLDGRYRTVNHTLREVLELYANYRPVRYLEGLPSPLRRPQGIDLVVVREATEDVLAGPEWAPGSGLMQRVRKSLEELGANIPDPSAVGLKVISERGTKRLVRKAIQWALDTNRSSITLAHFADAQPGTEGAFRRWAREVVEEFSDHVVGDDGQPASGGALVYRERIADLVAQQLVENPQDYDVIVCPNFTGEYLSDIAAALIGGRGVAPGANIGDQVALFEPNHGSAPKHAGKGTANPLALIRSGSMMLQYLGWADAAACVDTAVATTVKQGRVTQDLARRINGTTVVSTEGFGAAVIENIARDTGTVSESSP